MPGRVRTQSHKGTSHVSNVHIQSHIHTRHMPIYTQIQYTNTYTLSVNAYTHNTHISLTHFPSRSPRSKSQRIRPISLFRSRNVRTLALISYSPTHLSSVVSLVSSFSIRQVAHDSLGGPRFRQGTTGRWRSGRTPVMTQWGGDVTGEGPGSSTRQAFPRPTGVSGEWRCCPSVTSDRTRRCHQVSAAFRCRPSSDSAISRASPGFLRFLHDSE